MHNPVLGWKKHFHQLTHNTWLITPITCIDGPNPPTFRKLYCSSQQYFWYYKQVQVYDYTMSSQISLKDYVIYAHCTTAPQGKFDKDR